MSGKFIYCVLTLILLTVARFGHGETDPSTNIPGKLVNAIQVLCHVIILLSAFVGLIPACIYLLVGTILYPVTIIYPVALYHVL